MAVNQQIDIFTQAMTIEFAKSYREEIELAPIDKALWRMPSNARIENHLWMRLPPFFHRWEGMRQYGKPGTKKYAVENLTYTAEFQIPLEDMDDDQLGGFANMAAQLAENAKASESILVQQNLANGQTVPCFDGSNFFATSHNIGTGNNIVTATTADQSGNHAMVMLLTGRKKLKPLIWQHREAAELRTDAGDNVSSKNRVVSWWADMRGAPAFGLWQDAVLCKFTGVPTVAELQTALGTISSRFRTFLYPTNLPTDPPVAIHNNLQWSVSNALLLCDGGIEHIVRQALTLSLISTTENVYKGMADFATSYYLSTVS